MDTGKRCSGKELLLAKYSENRDLLVGPRVYRDPAFTLFYRAGRDESHVKEKEIKEYTATKTRNTEEAQNSIHDLCQR